MRHDRDGVSADGLDVRLSGIVWTLSIRFAGAIPRHALRSAAEIAVIPLHLPSDAIIAGYSPVYGASKFYHLK